MSEDLPAISKASDLQPLPSVKSRILRSLSLILILGGVTLLGTGGWMFYQIQVEANRPPPAPILDAKTAIEKAQAVDAELGQTEIEPAATPKPVSRAGERVEREPDQAAQPAPAREPESARSDILAEVDSIPVEEPAVIDEPVPAAAVAVEADEDVAIPAASPVKSPATTNDKFVEEANLVQEMASLAEPTAEAPLSLADNPLVVPEAVVEASEADNSAGEAALPAGLHPTRVVAKNIDLDSEVVEVGWNQIVEDNVTTNVWVVADFAAGWHKNSALPGQGGNIVLSGHHNIKGEVFRYLVDIEIGSIISLYVGDQRYDYAVSDKFIVKDKGEPEAVRRANARWIGPFNEERLTLVTCWPFHNNTHRVIVIAKPT
jgi:LPXTG-site transpeptidase (sortase) family protein